jgi:hypothetical protein
VVRIIQIKSHRDLNSNLNPKKMKKTKSLSSLLAFALTFACVLSCDDQDEKLQVEKESTSASMTRNNSGENLHVGGTEYTRAVGDPIDLGTAKNWTSNYRNSLENPDDRLAHYFGSEIINQILNQENCIGIRIYYGIDDLGNKQLMLVGVDATGENLVPLAGGRTNDDGNIIADASFPCPSTCPEVDL